MKAATINLQDDKDIELIDLPRVAELQMQLRALRNGSLSWREVKTSLLGCLAPAFVISSYMIRKLGATNSSILDYVAIFLMTLLPMALLCLLWDRRNRRSQLLEQLVHALVEQHNEQRRQLKRLQVG